MTVAALSRSPIAAAAPTRPRDMAAINRFEIVRDMASARLHWQALERSACLMTPYQAFDFLDLWHRHIGRNAGVEPFIVVGFDAGGTPAVVLPLGRRRLALGLSMIEFMGGKHSNFNLGLWRADVLATTTALNLSALYDRLAGEADVASLSNQPRMWAGRDNPLSLLPHQDAPDPGLSGPLQPDFDALFMARTSPLGRRKMRKKERVLAGFGTVTFTRAATDDEIQRVAEDFYFQKGARLRAMGLADVFAPQSVRDFVTSGALAKTATGDRLIELYTLAVDGTIVATLGGVCAGGRFSVMFSSIIHDRFATESPGEQLLVRVVRDCCARGLHTFDLGLGDARYKHLFCDADAMFDSYWPLTAKGRTIAAIRSALAAAKRTIKNNPLLWKLIVTTRRVRARLGNRPAAE